MADTLLDFDSAEALECAYVTVRRGGQEWRLRDDVRAGLMIQMLRVSKLEQALGVALYTDQDPDRAEELHREIETRTLRMCAEAFRHSYPSMTEEEVARLFPEHAARERIILSFFTTGGAGSSAPESAAPATPNAAGSTIPTPTPPTPPAMNRAARRATGKTATSGKA